MDPVVQNPENAALVRQATERHQPALRRYAAQLLGGDTTRAGAVSDAVLTVLAAQPADEVGDDLMEWLFTRARKEALAAMHRAGLPQRIEDAAAASVADESAGDTPHQMMQRLVNRLTPKQQEALRLKFQHGFTLKEIARITELSPFSVTLLMHNALSHVGREFAAPEGAPLPPALSDDPRFTAYALGEMEAGERKSFEAAQFDPKFAAAQVAERVVVGPVQARRGRSRERLRSQTSEGVARVYRLLTV